jgi:hypothetical protein
MKLLHYIHPSLHPQVEEFADKQKELESTIQPIMTRLYQGACRAPAHDSPSQRPDSSLRKIFPSEAHNKQKQA